VLKAILKHPLLTHPLFLLLVGWALGVGTGLARDYLKDEPAPPTRVRYFIPPTGTTRGTGLYIEKTYRVVCIEGPSFADPLRRQAHHCQAGNTQQTVIRIDPCFSEVIGAEVVSPKHLLCFQTPWPPPEDHPSRRGQPPDAEIGPPATAVTVLRWVKFPKGFTKPVDLAWALELEGGRRCVFQMTFVEDRPSGALYGCRNKPDDPTQDEKEADGWVIGAPRMLEKTWTVNYADAGPSGATHEVDVRTAWL
jgi:hypothetical protein